MLHTKVSRIGLPVPEKKIFEGFYHIWALRPSWYVTQMPRTNFVPPTYDGPQAKEAIHKIWH